MSDLPPGRAMTENDGGGDFRKKDPLARVLILVRQMRRCQVQYFKTRSQTWLVQSKQLEKMVDGLLVDLEFEGALPSLANEAEWLT